MYLSHKNQMLLNYFDDKDTRIRELAYSLGAQLLNTASQAIDDSEMRIERELHARVLRHQPCGIDNRGVYYGARLPRGFVVPDDGDVLGLVEGLRDGTTWVPISPYDDRLPVPVRVEQDLDRQAVVMSDPVLFDVTGTGDVEHRFWDTKSFAPGVLAIPNFLTFWLENIQAGFASVDVHIEGERFPRSPWVQDRVKSDEILTLSISGYHRTRLNWEQVDKITVRGLPTGTRLRCWAMPFDLPAFIDSRRSYTHAAYRDLEFTRYWELSNSDALLKENYFSGNLGGMEYVQSYSLPEPLTALAIEPETWGMFLASDSNLYYVDRREPMPEGIVDTGLVREPSYGLDVSLDVIKGTVRYVALRPVPYARAAQVVQYRYKMVDPNGEAWVLLPNGDTAPFTGQAGWRRPGVSGPAVLSISVPLTGTYLFTLECQDQPSGDISYDIYPYPNLALSPSRSFDISGQISAVRGIAYDALHRMWIWTGQYAVPFKAHYDAYVFDRASRTVFLTDPYSQVRFS